ncbi:MAG: hypothetical protein CBC65_001755 [Rhodothermaceae bacterium TMED105]|nr:MAG: hypothetical protein CBC65_001755 [Rhodothermaceae bacterium TMED105]
MNEEHKKRCGACLKGKPKPTTSEFKHLSPPRRVFTVAFAWREGPWNKGGGGRKSVRWYADSLMDMIHFYAHSDATCRFVIHVHGALTILDGLIESCRESFREGRALGGGKQDSHGVTFVVCDAYFPAMWPQATRVITLLDYTSEHDTTILVDIHDDLEKQSSIIQTLEDQMREHGKHISLTFWQTDGNLAMSFASDPSVLPPPRLVVDRSKAMVDKDRHWSLDAGLAICDPIFRKKLREVDEYVSYASFLQTTSTLVNYDDTRGTDESLLKLYLLTKTPSILELVRHTSALFTHTLSARSDDPPKRVPDQATPPVYAEQNDVKSLSFAYDEEHQGSLKFRPLKWEEPRPVSKRHKYV